MKKLDCYWKMLQWGQQGSSLPVLYGSLSQSEAKGALSNKKNHPLNWDPDFQCSIIDTFLINVQKMWRNFAIVWLYCNAKQVVA
ncbi:MAG: hypothetical protein ACRCW3_00580, partial [Metamycoplasmataceae bacterium]